MTDHLTPAAEQAPYLGVPEVCFRYGGRSRSWIYSSVESGDLPPFVKIGGKILFARKALDACDAARDAAAEREMQARLAERAAS